MPCSGCVGSSCPCTRLMSYHALCSYLDVIIDLSRAAQMADFRPSRLALMARAPYPRHTFPLTDPDMNNAHVVYCTSITPSPGDDLLPGCI